MLTQKIFSQCATQELPSIGVMRGLHTSASGREFPQHGGDRRGRLLDDGYVQVILNQAKLYIRPLQKDTSEEHMKPYSIPDVRNVGLYGCLVRMLCGIGSGEPNIYKNKKH